VTSEPRSASPQPDERGAPHVPRASWFGAVTRALNIVGTLLILAMALAVNADVIGRNAFNHPLPGVLEFIGLAIVVIVFLQMANTLREERHVSNDLLMHLVAASRPRLVAAFHACCHAIGGVLFALIAWFVWPLLADAYRGNYYAGTAGVIEIPTWPFLAAIIVGAVATVVQFLLLARQQLAIACGRRAGQ
jgi:TRAP-type C4-dicarboxylate transport system permease small subunit